MKKQIFSSVTIAGFISIRICSAVLIGLSLAACSDSGFQSLSRQSPTSSSVQSGSNTHAANPGTVSDLNPNLADDGGVEFCDVEAVPGAASAVYTAIGVDLDKVCQPEFDYWNGIISRYGLTVAINTATRFVVVSDVLAGESSVAMINDAANAQELAAAKNRIYALGVACSPEQQSCHQPSQPTLQEEINGLYIAMYNRLADSAGYDYWVNYAQSIDPTLREQGPVSQDVAYALGRAFASNPGFAPLSAISATRYAGGLYVTTGNSAGNSDGIKYWANRILQLQALGYSVQDSRGMVTSEFVNAMLIWDSRQTAGLTDQVVKSAIERQAIFYQKELSSEKNTSY